MNKRIFHLKMEQGSDEWFNIRAGKITASSCYNLFVKGKADHGFGTGAITSMYKIMEERITGEPRQSFSTKGTDWGHEYEPKAIEFYELQRFVTVDRIGFIEFGDFVGCSPDGIIPSMNKGVEVKCFPTGHMEMIDKKIAGKGEVMQCQYNLWCSGYDSWDLIYYHPNFPDHLKMLVFEIKPDLEMFKQFDELTTKFNKLIESKIESLCPY